MYIWLLTSFLAVSDNTTAVSSFLVTTMVLGRWSLTPVLFFCLILYLSVMFSFFTFGFRAGISHGLLDS